MERGYARKAFLSMALCSLLISAACASPPVRVLPLVGVPAYAPTDPSSIIVLRSEPPRRFQTLGQIIVEPEKPMPVPEIEQKLREAAAGMGANAVVIQADMTMQAGEDRQQQLSGGQVVTAIAIRFVD